MFQQWTISTKVEIVHTVHLWQMRLNNVALCHARKAILDKLRNWGRNLFWEKTIVGHYLGSILILCWLSRTFCLSGLMNGKIKKQEAKTKRNSQNMKPSKWRAGSRNEVVGEVAKWGWGMRELGFQAITIWQWQTTTCLPSFISIRSSVLLEFTFLSNSGQKRRVDHFRRKFREERVNRRQLRLVRWVGEGWGYHAEETRRWCLFWFKHSPRVSQTDRRTCL